MSPTEVRLHLRGPKGDLELDALLAAAEGLTRLLSARKSPVRWVVSDLQLSSLALAVRPQGAQSDEDLERLHALGAGIGAMVDSPGLPVGWDKSMVGELLEIARLPSTTSVTAVELTVGTGDSIRLDGVVERHLEETLQAPAGLRTLGSVAGIIRRYNGHRNEVGIDDPVTGKSITAKFSERLRGRIVKAVEVRVTAWGEIRRNERGEKVELIMQDFKEEDHGDLPLPVEQLIGIYGPDWTEGLSSEEWIRRQRER